MVSGLHFDLFRLFFFFSFFFFFSHEADGSKRASLVFGVWQWALIVFLFCFIPVLVWFKVSFHFMDIFACLLGHPSRSVALVHPF